MLENAKSVSKISVLDQVISQIKYSSNQFTHLRTNTLKNT